MPSLFKMAAGERTSISTEVVTLEFPDVRASGVLKTGVTYEATATDQFKQEPSGVWRRLFVDVSVDFGAGINSIWLTNDVDDPPDFVEKEDNDGWGEDLFI